MADKQPGINLNNWTFGMSADEYAGGSFLYGENINISRNSKSFRLSDRVIDTDITNRNVNHIALLGPYSSSYLISLSNDGYIESDQIFNENWTGNSGGAVYKRSSGGYINGTKIGNYTVGLTYDKLDLFTGDFFNTSTGIIPANGIVANPALTSNDLWTVGAGWTTGPTGAVHSSGVATLSQTLSVTNGAKYRVSIKITGHTLGTVTISMGGVTLATLSSSKQRNMYIRTTASASEDIVFTPSNTFNGTIQYVDIREYVANRIEEGKITITSSESHPLLKVGEYLYIGSGAKLDAVNTTSRSIDTYSLIDSDYNIVAINQIGQSIIIYATNKEDSKQFYRDGVSDAPSEVILWKDKVITNCVTDNINTYVLCESNYKKELYVVSGYTKILIALGRRGSNSFGYNKEVYRLQQRYDFHNNEEWSNAMGFYGNKLLIPSYQGLYTYGFENPGAQSVILKEFVLDTDTISATANIAGQCYIAYRTLGGTNRISSIREWLTSDTGYLVTNPILWDNFSTKKQLNRFRVGYILPANTSIEIFLNADKYYFITWTVSGITITPTIGTTYGYNSNIYEVISTNITGGTGTISCRVTKYVSSYPPYYSGTAYKLVGTGDASITYTDYTNFVKVKTITAAQYTNGEELIFGQEFLQVFMPDWHTIQIKIKLIGNPYTYISPEVFDIPFLAQPVGQND